MVDAAIAGVQRDLPERDGGARAAAVGRPRRAPRPPCCPPRTAPTSSRWATPRPRASRRQARWSTSPRSKDDLGGDDLLDSLVEAGTYDGQFYGVPLYAGARIVVYRTDLFEASGLEIPTTIEEFVEAGKTLQADNADVPNFSGIYFPGAQLARHAVVHLGRRRRHRRPGGRASGSAMLDSDESVAGPRDRPGHHGRTPTRPRPTPTIANDFVDFCNGEVGMLMGPGWKIGQIARRRGGLPGQWTTTIGAFALPGTDDGEVAPSFLGGSNLGRHRRTATTPSWRSSSSRS